MPRINTAPAGGPFLFACGFCGVSLKVAADLAGQTLNCPQCHELIRVPWDESRAAEHESLTPPPSWFAEKWGSPRTGPPSYESLTAPPSWFSPLLIWFLCSSMGFLSGFVYGFWFRGK